MLTYLQALKHEQDPDALFVDLDSSTKTSVKQLRFIGLKKRVIEVDMLDRIRKIEREKLFEVLESLQRMPYDHFYVDFGAPESEQLPGLFSIDYSMDEFCGFAQELGAEFRFNVVMAGGTAYRSCFDYLKRITELVDGRFSVTAFVNEYTFQHYEHLIDEIRVFAEATGGLVEAVRPFGDIHTDRNSGQQITDNVKEGKGIGDYRSFAARTIIRRELAKV